MRSFCLIITILFSSILSAQNFKGRITDSKGEPLHGSFVYIKEINQGLACNDEGYYQTTLKEGNYTTEFKCLGFKSIEKAIEIKGNEPTIVDISLKESPFNLSEVTVSAKEDPAYAIIRKAIEKAPLYASAAKEYKAEAYIKVNAELLKTSSFIDMIAKKGEGIKLSDFKDQLFMQESFNEVHFTAPDKYKQTVKAFSSSIPDNMKPEGAMGLMTSSLYNPKMGMFVSPLNPKAFSYYKFRYEGFIDEEELSINKIKVEPKFKDPILFDGYIYIADNTWHIHSAELATNAFGVQQDYKISYQELDTNLYLPITYIMDADINFLGIGAAMNYYASLTYKDIKLNKDTTEGNAKKGQNKKRNFEIAVRDSLYSITSDSLANKRDSAYWTNIRIVPLDKREIASLQKKDSIQIHLDSTRRAYNNKSFSWGDLISGGQIGGDSSKVTFTYNGLMRGLLLHEYNFVDGLWMGQSVSLKTKLRKKNELEIAPYIYYTLARKRLVGGGDLNLSYAPMKLGKLNISAGSVSEDYNPNGIHRFNNFSSSLIKGKNYSSFYQKNFVSATNSIDISNGLRFHTIFEIANRHGLSNHTDYTWGKKSKISENILPNDRFNKVEYRLGLDYTPYAYYTIRDGVKNYVKRTSPTFFMRFQHTLPTIEGKRKQFYKLYGGLDQYIKLNEFSSFHYLLEGGVFLGNKSYIHFADFQHFNTSDVMINLKSPFSSFMLLDNYTASTNKYWVRTNINYTNEYLLLKRLPFLQGKMFSETLHLKSLYTPDMKLYTEAGYSINLTQLVNAGAFVSFRKGKYQDFGIRLIFDWEGMKRAFE